MVAAHPGPSSPTTPVLISAKQASSGRFHHPIKDSQADSRGRVGLYVLLGLTAAAVLILLLVRKGLVKKLVVNFSSAV